MCSVCFVLKALSEFLLLAVINELEENRRFQKYHDTDSEKRHYHFY